MRAVEMPNPDCSDSPDHPQESSVGGRMGGNRKRQPRMLAPLVSRRVQKSLRNEANLHAVLTSRLPPLGCSRLPDPGESARTNPIGRALGAAKRRTSLMSRCDTHTDESNTLRACYCAWPSNFQSNPIGPVVEAEIARTNPIDRALGAAKRRTNPIGRAPGVEKRANEPNLVLIFFPSIPDRHSPGKTNSTSTLMRARLVSIQPRRAFLHSEPFRTRIRRRTEWNRPFARLTVGVSTRPTRPPGRCVHAIAALPAGPIDLPARGDRPCDTEPAPARAARPERSPSPLILIVVIAGGRLRPANRSSRSQ